MTEIERGMVERGGIMEGYDRGDNEDDGEDGGEDDSEGEEGGEYTAGEIAQLWIEAAHFVENEMQILAVELYGARLFIE